MNITLPAAATKAAAPFRTAAEDAACLLKTAETILTRLESGLSVDANILRDAMEEAFGGSDAEGLWTWKLAYEATEAAQVLFLRKYGRAMQDKAASPTAMLTMLSRLASLLPTQTRRSEESQALQQFSTPFPLAWVASIAAGIKPDDTVLEPSAGTGMLAVFADISGAHLALNEIAETRAALLHRLFPEAVMSRHDAASIDDRLAGDIIPSVILMNPPFSAAVNVKGRAHEADFHHVRSALARLPQGGRLIAITGHNFPVEKLSGAVRFTCTIDGSVYAKHGTSFETRLTIIDKSPESITPPDLPQAAHVADLLANIAEHVPPRMDVCGKTGLGAAKPVRAPKAAPVVRKAGASTLSPAPEAIELAYEPVEWKPAEGADLSDAIYEGYTVQSIQIPGAAPHPTKLVQSAAMASVAPPHPSYRPHLPSQIIHDSILSGAQLESVVYAGEAHSGHMAGAWIVDETGDNLHAAPDGAEDAVRFRRGWFLGDGTGYGKGRQVAGVILDNWIKGRRKSLWISKSDKLIEDARRDWSALGAEPLLIQPLSRFKSGAPVRLLEGILFCTYATLRNEPRLKQIIDWLGRAPGSETKAAFDGVIVFDEAHAMANAAGGKGERGDQLPSQQGRAGLRLQRALPDARIVYVSATGATDVRNLAYAERLGLWGGADFPFANRAEFIEAVEAGGVAAMEILARDMKSLGLYTARSLSYDGVEIEIVEHALTAAQIDIYDAYPHELSGGMQQRVGIARALVMKPSVLLMDEPYGALDVQTRELLQDELLQIWERAKTTVIFVTHSIEEALYLADRIVLMSSRPGRIRQIIDVPFPRPREETIKSAPEFLDLRREIWRLLKSETKVGEIVTPLDQRSAVG